MNKIYLIFLLSVFCVFVKTKAVYEEPYEELKRLAPTSIITLDEKPFTIVLRTQEKKLIANFGTTHCIYDISKILEQARLYNEINTSAYPSFYETDADFSAYVFSLGLTKHIILIVRTETNTSY